MGLELSPQAWETRGWPSHAPMMDLLMLLLDIFNINFLKRLQINIHLSYIPTYITIKNE